MVVYPLVPLRRRRVSVCVRERNRHHEMIGAPVIIYYMLPFGSWITTSPMEPGALFHSRLQCAVCTATQCKKYVRLIAHENIGASAQTT